MQLETVVHFVVQRVTSYGWLPKLDTHWIEVLEAAGMCSTVENAGKLHRALGNLKHKRGKGTGFSLRCSKVDTWAIY